jgi:hypothetical protein
VTKSNKEETRPKTTMKFLMNPIDHRLGQDTNSESTLSPAMVISGRSVNRLVRRTGWEAEGGMARTKTTEPC